jgi:hypothetical protein
MRTARTRIKKLMKAGLPVMYIGMVSVSCTSKGPHPAEGEGDFERDPGTDPGDAPPPEEDTGTASPLDDPGTAPPPDDTGTPPTGETVCYPGALTDYTACFAVVNATDSMGEDYAYPEPYLGNPQYRKPTRYVDLRVADHSQAVAKNFVFDEFMSVAKGPFGLFQVHAMESLQAVREASGGSVTVNSGYRNVSYNEGVGGAEYSRHMYGDAADIRSSVLSLSALAELCEDFGAGFTKLYDTHVHCDWRDDLLDPVFFE